MACCLTAPSQLPEPVFTFCGIYLRAVSQCVPNQLFCIMSLKIIYFKNYCHISQGNSYSANNKFCCKFNPLCLEGFCHRWLVCQLCGHILYIMFISLRPHGESVQLGFKLHTQIHTHTHSSVFNPLTPGDVVICPLYFLRCQWVNWSDNPETLAYVFM